MKMEHMNNDSCNDGKVYELIQVQVLMRHGARTPVTNLDINDFPNFEEAAWDISTLGKIIEETDVPVSVSLNSGGKPLSVCDQEYQRKGPLKGGMLIGKLTTIGQKQARDLGIKLKERYHRDNNMFLSCEYDPIELSIRTSDIERTIISARCVTCGLYGKENIKEPIKMYTMAASEEFIYPNWGYCKALKAWKQQINYVHCSTHVHDLTVKMNGLLGITDPQYYMDLVAIDDLVCCRKIHGFSTPDQLLEHEDEIRQGAAQIFTLILQGKEKTVGLRSSIGDLLNELCENFELSKEGKRKFKMKLYSTHDSTLMSLLMVFDQWNHDLPPFSSHLILEHYKDENSNDYVKIVYNGQELKLNEKEKFIPLPRFLQMVDPYRVKDSQENFPSSRDQAS